MSPPGVMEAEADVFVPGSPKWWQWPTILSLDAPAVAISWQALLAKVVDARLAGHHVALLGLSVWLAYVADRWIEGWRLTARTVRTQRHYFYLRRRWPAFGVWLAALGGGVGLAAARFTGREWAASLGLLAATLVYLLSHQFAHRNHPWRLPKELCVAAIVALGAALYPAVLAPARMERLVAPVALLVMLALTNCLLISEWERAVDRRHRQTSLALRYDDTGKLARWLAATIAVLGAGLAPAASGPARSVAWCGVASAVLLLVLASRQPLLGRERARALVDCALLTPLVALAFT